MAPGGGGGIDIRVGPGGSAKCQQPCTQAHLRIKLALMVMFGGGVARGSLTALQKMGKAVLIPGLCMVARRRL